MKYTEKVYKKLLEHFLQFILVLITSFKVSNLTKATKNPVNQATARAALTQISNVIFQRMEQYNVKFSILWSLLRGYRVETRIIGIKGNPNLQ